MRQCAKDSRLNANSKLEFPAWPRLCCSQMPLQTDPTKTHPSSILVNSAAKQQLAPRNCGAVRNVPQWRGCPGMRGALAACCAAASPSLRPPCTTNSCTAQHSTRHNRSTYPWRLQRQQPSLGAGVAGGGGTPVNVPPPSPSHTRFEDEARFCTQTHAVSSRQTHKLTHAVSSGSPVSHCTEWDCKQPRGLLVETMPHKILTVQPPSPALLTCSAGVI